jgi:hypothetical protein
VDNYPFRGIAACHAAIDNPGVVSRPVGRLTMLQWRPRLVALAVVIALLLIALAGASIEDIFLNLYW